MAARDVLRTLIEEKKRGFKDPSAVTDEKALGILVAEYFRWDGQSMLEVAEAGLIDSNFAEAGALVGAAELS